MIRVLGPLLALILATAAMAQQAPPLDILTPTATDRGHAAHILPFGKTLDTFLRSRSKTLGPLVSGGTPLVCTPPCTTMPTINVRLVFASPTTLQDGTTPATYETGYIATAEQLAMDFATQELAGILTQYYDQQTTNGPKTYIINAPEVGQINSLYGTTSTGNLSNAVWLDPDTLPAKSGQCPSTNCIQDSDVQNELSTRALTGGWTAKSDLLYIYFLPQGEDVCLTNQSLCASNSFCGYHGWEDLGTNGKLIYAVIPYATSRCTHSTGTDPNISQNVQIMTAIFAHEFAEAIVRPLISSGTGWVVSGSGNSEVADACIVDPPSAIFGTNTYDNVGGVFLANHRWSSAPNLTASHYELPMLLNNHASVSGVPNSVSCDQFGPISFH